MTWSPNPLKAGLAAAAALALFGSGATAATTAAAPSRDCFFVNQWRGWSAPDGDTLYLRVGLRDIYRVELTPGSHVRKWPDRHLVQRVHGSNSICSHLDLSLTLADNIGTVQPLIARSLVKLTPEEIAKIPKKHLP